MNGNMFISIISQFLPLARELTRVPIRDVPILPYRASGTGLPAVFWYLLLGIGPQKILQSICG